MSAPSAAERQEAFRALTTLSRRDLAAIWRKLDLSHPDRLAEPLAQVLAEIADKYGTAAASLAADWYDEARADAAVGGAFTAAPAQLPDADRFDALSRWGVGPLFGANPDAAAALSLIAGGLQRIVIDQARDTTAGNVALDPSGPTYARHASANACAFCAMLATRGAVYASSGDALRVTGHSLGGTDYRKMHRLGTSRESIFAGSRAKTIAQGGRKGRETTREIGAKYHDDCHCTVIEVFPGQEYAEAPYVAQWRETYNNVKATGGPNDAIDLKATLSSMRQALDAN